jgi:hypothetical protein
MIMTFSWGFLLVKEPDVPDKTRIPIYT